MSIRKKHGMDLSGILAGLFLAVVFAKTGVFEQIIAFGGEFTIITNFIAGMFFTSAFTTPAAMVALGELAQAGSVWTVAGIGAFGAVTIDLLIFLLFREKLSERTRAFLSIPKYRRFLHLFHHKFFRWLTPFLGALVIASPLPDELGLAMMGLSRLHLPVFLPVSFAANFVGILLIGTVAQSL